eukprot:296913-Chlamydomonas_euryale.AAC.7
MHALTPAFWSLNIPLIRPCVASSSSSSALASAAHLPSLRLQQLLHHHVVNAVVVYGEDGELAGGVVTQRLGHEEGVSSAPPETRCRRRRARHVSWRRVPAVPDGRAAAAAAAAPRDFGLVRVSRGACWRGTSPARRPPTHVARSASLPRLLSYFPGRLSESLARPARATRSAAAAAAAVGAAAAGSRGGGEKVPTAVPSASCWEATCGNGALAR